MADDADADPYHNCRKINILLIRHNYALFQGAGCAFFDVYFPSNEKEADM